MSAPRLLVVPHWRPQVHDIVQTIRDSADASGSELAIVGRGRAWTRRSAGGTGRLAMLVSDTKQPRVLHRASYRNHIHALRLWWNGADEILDYRRDRGRRDDASHETHVCFFSEVLEELSGTGLDVLCIPYAFTSPRRPTECYERRIVYTSEVDISDACFVGRGVAPTQAKSWSDRSWDLAEQIVHGDSSLVDADRLLRDEVGEDTPPLWRTTLWSLRNRVRYLLVKQVVDAFPGWVTLRGSDWARLGFDARSTSFRRGSRMDDYRKYRVALDLGSKSTHAALYPRTADIMAVGGGIVQFDSGEGSPEWSSALLRRRASSVRELLARIDKLLSMDEKDLSDENGQIQRDYSTMRLHTGNRLIEEVLSRVA